MCWAFEIILTFANLDRPETPNSLAVVPYGTHIIVSWTPGFNGGFSQLFVIQYRTGNKEDWSTSDPINDTLVNNMTYILNDVVSNTQYFVRMFSTNIVVGSDKTNVKVARTYGECMEMKICDVSIHNKCSSESIKQQFFYGLNSNAAVTLQRVTNNII